jgi:hypothetical protein
MRIQTAIFAATVGLCLPAATTAHAEDLLSASTPETLAALFQLAGMQAKLDKDAVGDPMISSAASGANFDLYFYDCKDGKNCSSVQFDACFDMVDGVKLDVINSWNYDMRYGKASVDENLDPCLKMDIQMLGGIPAANFSAALDTWATMLGRFVTKIGY